MLDWLSFDLIQEGTEADGRLRLSVVTNPMAVKWLALQYVDKVEILTPVNLRNDIRDTLKDAVAKYK